MAEHEVIAAAEPGGQAVRSGAQVLVEALEAAGVTRLFGIPGEENTDLMFALEGSGIEVVLTRHEQAAAFMASVHGRITGQPAVCLSTLGPGATNLVTGVADAQLDGVPLIATTAQGATGRLHRAQSHQVIDLTALFAPVTKLSRTIMRADTVAECVAEAAAQATTPRPGAVHLSLPEDVAAAPTGAPTHPAQPPQRQLPDPAAVLRAVEALRRAQRPLVVAGRAAMSAGAPSALRALVEACGLPLATTFMAKGILPAEHPLHLHMLGQPFEDHVDHAVRAADLILAVGVDPVEAPVSAITGGRTPVVHLGALPAAAGAGWTLAADVTGSVGATLRALVLALAEDRWTLPDAMVRVRDAIHADRGPAGTPAEAREMHPRDICRQIEAWLRPEDQLLSGVGAHKLWISRQIAAQRPGQIIVPNGLAGMGLALPGAMAAAPLVAGRVLVICGDGDFMMNVQEMETAARLALPLTVMLWEDGGYGLIGWEQRMRKGAQTDLAFGNPDWEALAGAFGWHVRPVARFGDLDDSLRATRGDAGPVLMPLAVDYSANDALSAGAKVGKPAQTG